MNQKEREKFAELIERAVTQVTTKLATRIDELTERCNDLQSQLSAIPAGPQGEPGPPGPAGEQGPAGKAAEPARDGRDGRNGKDGRDGIDGKDGRDVYEIEILNGFEADRSYHKGTLAAKDGGLFRYTGTEWVCMINGLKSIEPKIAEDLTVTLAIKMADGREDSLQFSAPGLVYKGVWKSKEFEPGQVVTFDGSMWICLKKTKAKPGEYNKDWQLSVKRGRNGKSA